MKTWLWRFASKPFWDRDLLIALHASEESLRATAKEAFGIHPSLGFLHKCQTRQGVAPSDCAFRDEADSVALAI